MAWRKSKVTSRYLARRGKTSIDRPECMYCGVALKSGENIVDIAGQAMCDRCATSVTGFHHPELEMPDINQEAPISLTPPAPIADTRTLVSGRRW